jgi:hypothetical protein
MIFTLVKTAGSFLDPDWDIIGLVRSEYWIGQLFDSWRGFTIRALAVNIQDLNFALLA